MRHEELCRAVCYPKSGRSDWTCCGQGCWCGWRASGEMRTSRPTHFYFADRYRRLATHQRNQSVDYRRTDFFADLDLAASLDTDFFAAVLAAAFLALVFLAEVFLAAVFFVVSFKTPALAASALTALPTGILLTCFATDVPAATAFV